MCHNYVHTILGGWNSEPRTRPRALYPIGADNIPFPRCQGYSLPAHPRNLFLSNPDSDVGQLPSAESTV
ncbi:MAG: hypothetical protein ACTSRP_19040 [Candidatus Helarchaeota archaeon]